MLALIGLFAGALLGHLLWRDWGSALGGIAGFIVGAKLAARRPVRTDLKGGAGSEARAHPPAAAPVDASSSRVESSLSRRVADLERRVADLERAGPVSSASGVVGDVPPTVPAPAEPASELATDAFAVLPGSMPAPPPIPLDAAAVASAPAPPAFAAAPAAQPHRLWRWCTGGNVLTRVGVVVLFFGVAFLLRYFAERFTLPIELRLALVAVAGLALAGVGARLAPSRPGYGLSLEGAGLGILYLTTYAAFRLYGVLPELPTMAVLVAVSASTVGVAIRSDSQALAGLAIAGGFLAPMLVGPAGEPVHLFGYFAVLNGAVFALAWRRAWRALNAVGFVFTFVLGGFWGHEFYLPEHYAVVQPFLALFFAFYVAIAVLHARFRSLAARDPVDGLLVFGVPLAAFTLQSALVAHTRYGAAWSAVALAGFYALVAYSARRREGPGFSLLSRAFAALAVIFATIAIPLAFDRRATAALWAVEAAGVFWIGVRQNSRPARLFALLVEAAAGVAFAFSGAGAEDARFVANAYFAGALLVALSGLATARIADRAGDTLPGAERSVVPLVFAWGVMWWLAAGGLEIDRHLPREQGLHATLAWVTTSVALALFLARRLRWHRLCGAAIALLPTMVVVALGDIERERTTLLSFGWIVFPAAWIVHWIALKSAEPGGDDGAGAAPRTEGERALRPALHAISALALTVHLAWEASEWVGRETALHTAWMACAAALPAIVFLGLVDRCYASKRWPFSPHRDAYAAGAGRPVALLLVGWFFIVNALSPGDPAPFPYAPIANPLDLTLALALLALVGWSRRHAGIAERARYAWAGAALFVALNGVVVRTAHAWGGVPWRIGSMLASKPLQAALTLTWTATALGAMYVATRRRIRPLWMIGAALLAAVVAKLFVVDLSALSGLPRVVAFLGAGILLLVIGFVAPLPPSASEPDRDDSGPPRP